MRKSQTETLRSDRARALIYGEPTDRPGRGHLHDAVTQRTVNPRSRPRGHDPTPAIWKGALLGNEAEQLPRPVPRFGGEGDGQRPETKQQGSQEAQAGEAQTTVSSSASSRLGESPKKRSKGPKK